MPFNVLVTCDESSASALSDIILRLGAKNAGMPPFAVRGSRIAIFVSVMPGNNLKSLMSHGLRGAPFTSVLTLLVLQDEGMGEHVTVISVF